MFIVVVLSRIMIHFIWKPDEKMPPFLTKDQKVEIIENLSWFSVAQTAEMFNLKYRDRPPIQYRTIRAIQHKFKTTGSLENIKSTGRPKITNNVEKVDRTLDYFNQNPDTPVRIACVDLMMHRKSVRKILKSNGYKPYKYQTVHQLHPGDAELRVEFCHEFLDEVHRDPMFPFKVLWTDESLFTLNGTPNKQNYRYVCILLNNVC